MPVAETDMIPGSRKEEDSGAGETLIAGIKGGKRLGESRFLLVLGALAALVLALAVYDAVAFLMDAYSASALLGGFYSLLMLVVIATIGWWVRGIVSELRAINDISRLRNRGESLMRASCDPRLSDDLRAYVGELSAHYRHDARLRGRLVGLPSRLEQLSTRRGLEGREGIYEISKTLYGDIDRQALDLVVKRAQQTALMTAVSRIPLLDLVIVLWRSLSLTLEIAKLYGGRPGRIGLLRLSRLCLYNVVFIFIQIGSSTENSARQGPTGTGSWSGNNHTHRAFNIHHSRGK